MKWVKEFYTEQFVWLKDFDYDMEEIVEIQINRFERFITPSTKKILELGGGNGQFAVSAALNGYEVTMIELVPECVGYANELARKYNVESKLRVIQGDFYQADFDEQFDVVCYWDGFGVGSDSDQQVLLNRISKWLKPRGTALIDIYTPWYWSKTAGQEMKFGKILRKYDFDADGNRMLDTWWLNNNDDHKITQSLRCYSPADLRLLLKDIDLSLVHCEPGGAMDYETLVYSEQVPLEEAMVYLAKLHRD